MESAKLFAPTHKYSATTEENTLLEVVNPQSIELIAAKAFPAAFIHVSRGWLLRHTPGVGSRRANSVLPLTFMRTGNATRVTNSSIDEALEECCAFYSDRGLPVRFQVSPAASPLALDDILAARGFVKEGSSLAMSAPIASAIDRLDTHREYHVLITRRPSPEWFAFYLKYGTGKTMNTQSAKDLLFRIQGEPMFAGVLTPSNEMIGIGLGVHDDWLGLFSIATHPDYTRRGVASLVVRALAERGAINGADHVFLQVEAENRPAIALYEKAGFSVAYPYHYRSLSSFTSL